MRRVRLRPNQLWKTQSRFGRSKRCLRLVQLGAFVGQIAVTERSKIAAVLNPTARVPNRVLSSIPRPFAKKWYRVNGCTINAQFTAAMTRVIYVQ